MNAAPRPGGRACELAPHKLQKDQACIVKQAVAELGDLQRPDLPAEVIRKIEAFVDEQRYFASSQEQPEIQHQLEAVAVAGRAESEARAEVERARAALLSAEAALAQAAAEARQAVDALGEDAMEMYLNRLPSDADGTLAGRYANEAAALSAIPRLEPEAKRGKQGRPILEQLVHRLAPLLHSAGARVVERNQGPLVRAFEQLHSVLPDDLREDMGRSDFGETIKGILQKAARTPSKGTPPPSLQQAAKRWEADRWATLRRDR